MTLALIYLTVAAVFSAGFLIGAMWAGRED